MRKILSLLLIVVISMGMSGCVESLIKTAWKAGTDVSEGEQEAMLRHLEKKYGEKFVIKEIHLPKNEAELERGATVYPEGREDEEFHVYLGTVGAKKIVDTYVFREPEKLMTTLYEEWIRTMIPSAKVAVKMTTGLRTPELFYDPNKTLQQFVEGAKDISLRVNIMLSEDKFENKDEIFEKLSNLLESELVLGFTHSEYRIGFFVQDVFNSKKLEDYADIPLYPKPKNAPGNHIVAVTYCFSENSDNRLYTQSELLEKMYENLEIREERNE